MTPFKKWAIFSFIEGIFFLGLAFILVIFATNFASQTHLAIALVTFVFSLYCFVCAANFTIADTIIDETFQICPLCFSSNILIDVKFCSFKHKVLCRDCHAQWEFYIVFGSLTRLSITDYGIALRAEEKSLVPSTDNPEHWRRWAKERFRQRQQLSQPTPATQGQAIFCRFCGHRNLLDAKFCSACGKELQA
jgi:hypothetical protein